MHAKHERMTMSDEIETLRAKMETLEVELQVEEQKEESLQEDIEILQEKIEIRSLEKELDTKRESVKQLESKKSELEGEWNQPVQNTTKDEEQKEPSSEPTITVMPPQISEPVESQESSAQKKRRWL
jgi:predicted RNase H-like nuclease (RuvC/YqgF family)